MVCLQKKAPKYLSALSLVNIFRSCKDCNEFTDDGGNILVCECVCCASFVCLNVRVKKHNCVMCLCLMVDGRRLIVCFCVQGTALFTAMLYY